MGFDIEKISREFDVEREASPYGNGHINDTFVVDGKPRHIMQRINAEIFKDVDGLMGG